MAEIDSLYNKRNGKILIEISLTSVIQIFNTLDPSPFFEKQLDDDAERYIVDTVNDFPKKTEFAIVIHLPKECSASAECRVIPDAIHNHFRYKAIAEERHLRQKMLYGRFTLFVALVFLAVSLFVSQAVMQLGNGLLFYFISEAFMISGWVAMWAPVTLFLYELYPILQTKHVYEKISRMEIEILPK